MIKVLNAYAGIGGNRKLWQDVDVTAVEIEPKIAAIYQDFFPDDKVIITDAHQYLLEHYKEFDFIWSSPPCPSHSHIRKELAVEARGQNEPIYPDMQLYEEILFLQGYCKNKWIIENVVSWYEPLIKPQKIDRHYFWSNFIITKREFKKAETSHRKVMGKRFDVDLSELSIGHRKDQILRNMVNPELGLHILNCAFNTFTPYKDYYKQEILI